MVTIDSYSEANQSNLTSIHGVHPSVADSWLCSSVGQSFTGLANYNVTSCKFFLWKTGLPVGNLKAVLSAHGGTYGTNSVPSGGALATSAAVAMASLTVTPTLYTFTFPAPYYKVSATQYTIEVRANDATTLDNTTPNRIEVGDDTSAPSHGGNYFFWYNGAWITNNTRDLIFYVLGSLSGIKGGSMMNKMISVCHNMKRPLDHSLINRKLVGRVVI